jgi:hypothetical protein
MKLWKKTNDFYNRETVTQDVYSRKYKWGKIHVINQPSIFTYTFSFGKNSDYSHTGCLAGYSKITTVETALRVIDEIAGLFFEDKYDEIQILLERYK